MKQLSIFIILLSLITSSYASYAPEEMRIGVLRHDVGSGLRHRHEKGYDANLEALWSSPDYAVFKYIFAPKPHLGASLNTRKGSHQFYAGLTWRFDFFSYYFIEGSFGGEVHTGNINKRTRYKQKLGCRLLFRESVSLGVKFKERHSVSLILDHASNASCGKTNPGLTAFGLRYGYRF